MYFITTKRMLEVCFSVHPNIQYRTFLWRYLGRNHGRGLMRLAILGTIGRKLTFCKIWEKVFM